MSAMSVCPVCKQPWTNQAFARGGVTALTCDYYLCANLHCWQVDSLLTQDQLDRLQEHFKNDKKLLKVLRTCKVNATLEERTRVVKNAQLFHWNLSCTS